MGEPEGRAMATALDLSKPRAVLLDLDGVMYRGAQLCNGAAEFVRAMRARAIRPFYLSNNSRAGADVVAKKLTSLGVPTADQEVVTAAELTVDYLAAQRRKGTVSVIGSDPSPSASKPTSPPLPPTRSIRRFPFGWC